MRSAEVESVEENIEKIDQASPNSKKSHDSKKSSNSFKSMFDNAKKGFYSPY